MTRNVQSSLAVMATVATYAAVMTTLNTINTPKIGYVDSSILMERFHGAVEARAEIQDKVEAWQTNLRTLETELDQISQEILESGEEWDQETRSAKQDVLAKKQGELLRYRRAVGEKAAMLEQELMEPVFGTLNTRIRDFGRGRDYDFIFGTVSGGNILYAREATDLTETFLAHLNGRED